MTKNVITKTVLVGPDIADDLNHFLRCLPHEIHMCFVPSIFQVYECGKATMEISVSELSFEYEGSTHIAQIRLTPVEDLDSKIENDQQITESEALGVAIHLLSSSQPGLESIEVLRMLKDKLDNPPK